jgi:glycosyltransferase involved in cell wall biosynthesis
MWRRPASGRARACSAQSCWPKRRPVLTNKGTPPLGLRSVLKFAGKGDAKVALVFGRDAADCHRAVLHVREGAPEVPVWLFSTTKPWAETADLCERVFVRGTGLSLLFAAERCAWPRWVALSVAPWTGDRFAWPLKLAPFLIPPGRALLLNEHGDFFAGSPSGVAEHLRRRSRDALSALWNGARESAHKAGDALRTAITAIQLVILMAVGRMLALTGYAYHRWFANLHGSEALRVDLDRPAGVLRRPLDKLKDVNSRLALWGEGPVTTEMLALFEDPRTFAVSPQTHFRAWKPAIVPTAPFRTLQTGEASQVLAPLSHSILVDRAKLLALGIPDAGLAWSAWMLVFWKAAAAGWRSYSIGGDPRLKEQPDLPVQETEFFLRFLTDSSFRRLGPREPELARGAVAFPIADSRPGHRVQPRVLVVSPFLPFPLSHGGAVRIWNLCRALAPRVDFILAAIREKHDTADYAKLQEVFRDVRIIDIDQRASTDERLPAQVRGHQSAVMRAAIADLAREWRPDILQIEYTHMAHFRDAAPEIPAILVEHDLTFSLYRQLADSKPGAEATAEYQKWLEFERAWLKNYDGVWTVSEEDRGVVVRESGRSADTTFNVPNGVDIDRFRPQGNGTAQEILYVGSFRHLPNTIGFQKLEREVMPRVWKVFPGARLRVVAGPRYEQFWKKRPLDGRIEVQGFVEDLRPLYGSAAVVVVPLEVSAGTNIKVLEAMACGRPVVTTPVGCAGLDLRDGVDACIRADWESFATAVCDLLADRALRETMGTHARATTEERFSWTPIAERAFASYCAVNVAVDTLPGSV